jgi:hypothetical protein
MRHANIAEFLGVVPGRFGLVSLDVGGTDLRHYVESMVVLDDHNVQVQTQQFPVAWRDQIVSRSLIYG